MISIKQFEQKYINMITDDEIKKHLSEDEYDEFDNWLAGQTCPIGERGERGVFRWDLERWLNIKKHQTDI
jgi:hypothetical protein